MFLWRNLTSSAVAAAAAALMRSRPATKPQAMPVAKAPSPVKE